MVCSQCGKELSEDSKFCGYCGGRGEEPAPAAEAVCAACGAGMTGQFCSRCGAKAGGGVQAPPKPESREEAGKAPPRPESREEVGKAPPRPPKTPGGQKKGRGKRFLIILAAVLLLGVAAGLWGAHYVAKNGWESVPFAEKLTFLPFVRLDKERTETYSDPVEDIEDAEDKKDGEPAQADSEEPGGEAPALSAAPLEGDWVFESRDGYILLRFNADGTYALGTSMAPVMDWISSTGGPQGEYDPSGAAEFTLNREGGASALAAVTGGMVQLTLDGGEYELTQSLGPTLSGVLGVWYMISESEGGYLNFLPSGDLYRGEAQPDGGVRWQTDDGAFLAHTVYTYDAERGILRGDSLNEQQVRIVGEYAWLEDDRGMVRSMKYVGGSQSFPMRSPSDYILPDSNRRNLNEDDVGHLTLEELKLARNEIYARHGRLFDDPELQAYFNSRSWYHGTVSPDAFDDALLSDVERENAIMIREVEDARAEQGPAA